MLKKWMYRMFYSCRDVTEMIEKKKVVGLKPMESIRYRVHLLMCRACLSYEKQAALLEKMVHKLVDNSLSEQIPPKMDDASKAKILEKIKKKSMTKKSNNDQKMCKKSKNVQKIKKKFKRSKSIRIIVEL